MVDQAGVGRMDRRLAELARVIADDAFAASHQTMGQYRTALLAALRSQAAQRSGPTREQVEALKVKEGYHPIEVETAHNGAIDEVLELFGDAAPQEEGPPA